MAHQFHIRHQFSGKVLHTVDAGDRPIELYAPDLRGVSLENANLVGADLRHANLAGVCLRGARLREADLSYANLGGADLSYSDLRGARLENANLMGTLLYPAETIGAKFYGAKFASGSDAAEYARLAQIEMCRRMRIKPNSVAYIKLQRINGWDLQVPIPDIRPARRGRPRCFVESL
jgi:uncharacterized protein YjbI with pentapeptide repeats